MPRRLAGPLLAAALTLQAAVVLGGPPAYTFQPIVYVNDPIPGGSSTFNWDFEPSAINNQGEYAFTADYGEGEGVFLSRAGTALGQVVGYGQPAPGTGGQFFGAWEWGNIGINDEGDLAFPFSLEPLTHWYTWFGGLYGGVWRYSHITHKLTPVFVPGDPIPGPGGGTFKGVGMDVSMNNQGPSPLKVS